MWTRASSLRKQVNTFKSLDCWFMQIEQLCWYKISAQSLVYEFSKVGKNLDSEPVDCVSRSWMNVSCCRCWFTNFFTW